MSGRIPVTILSGYLGAGKTTIINQVLGEADGMRLAVLVNDFGPVNIDAALVRARGRDVVELSNGCICFTIGDDLGETLTAIAARPERPDRVLIEASGVAEPARIAMASGHWPGFELDAVFVAADAETIRMRANDKFVGQLVRNQLDSADIVLLTKTDLIGSEAADATETWLHARRRVCVTRVVNGHVPPAPLFSRGLPAPFGERGSSPRALAGFVTRVWQPAGPVDLSRLKTAFADMPARVQRAKGFVVDETTGRPVLIQCVGNRTQFTPAFRGETGVVFISVGDRSELDAFCADLSHTVCSAT